jgi:hypothetical protein
MNAIHPQYITNENGEKVSVVIPIAEYEQMIEEWENVDDIKIYDEVKSLNETPMSFDEYINERRLKLH